MWSRFVDWLDDTISDPTGYLVVSFVIIITSVVVGTHFLLKYFPPPLHPCR